MSWQSHLVSGFLRLGKWQFQHRDVSSVRAMMRMYMNRLAEFQLQPSWAHCRLEIINGVPCEWVWVPETEHTTGVIIYLHGGGFMAGSPASHRDLAWRLSRASGRRVLLVDYRLTPDFAYPAQLEDALAVYRGLLDRGIGAERLALAGDSAGGNLALACVLACRDVRLPLPAAVVCFSPWADLTHSGASIVANAARDTMIPVHLLEQVASLYYADADPRAELISPVFADFKDFPPLSLHVAAEEVLLDDTLRIAERAQAAGVAVEFRIWQNVPHAFPVIAQLLPEGRAALQQSGIFLQRLLAAENDPS
jgi:acetyl esterase/lipase